MISLMLGNVGSIQELLKLFFISPLTLKLLQIITKQYQGGGGGGESRTLPKKSLPDSWLLKATLEARSQWPDI